MGNQKNIGKKTCKICAKCKSKLTQSMLNKNKCSCGQIISPKTEKKKKVILDKPRLVY